VTGFAEHRGGRANQNCVATFLFRHQPEKLTQAEKRDPSIQNRPFEIHTSDKHWLPEVNRILSDFIPRRREILLNQLRERGLSPANPAPPRD